MTVTRLLTRVAPFPLVLMVVACSASTQSASTQGTTALGAPTPPAATQASAASSPSAQAATSASPAATATAAATVPAATVPASSAPSPGAVSSSSRASAQSCAAYAASHTFIELVGGYAATDGTLSMSGHPATLVCGGPDDQHYTMAASTENITVPASATIKVLTANSSGIANVTIRNSALPTYLETDHNTRVFLITGPTTAITALTEMFHP